MRWIVRENQFQEKMVSFQMKRNRYVAVVSLLLGNFIHTSAMSRADPVLARHKQGSGHAFLALKALDGRILAVGEVLEVTQGSIVTSRLTFHFRDGSVDEDTTVFEQGNYLRLLSDHHIQKGPSYPHPIDILIDVKATEVAIRSLDTGIAKVEYLDLPDDLANGLLPQILQDIASVTVQTKVSYVAAGSKPRIVQLIITPEGTNTFSIAGTTR